MHKQIKGIKGTSVPCSRIPINIEEMIKMCHLVNILNNMYCRQESLINAKISRQPYGKKKKIALHKIFTNFKRKIKFLQWRKPGKNKKK